MKRSKIKILFILPVILLLFIFNTTAFAKKSNTTNNFVSAASPAVPLGSGPSAIATGHFNLGTDAYLDMAVVNYDGNSISVFLGNGNGTFQPGIVTSTAGLGPYSIVADYLDADGNLDVAVANSDGNTITILFGNGSGSFSSVTSATYNDNAAQSVPYSITSCDFDNDGNKDLVVANLDSDNVSILIGNGSGAFSEDPASPITIYTGAEPASIAAADFDGDSIDEVIIANYGLNSISIISDVNLTTTYEYISGQAFQVGINPISIAIEDFNGDGDKDVATANVNGGNISVLLGYGNGTFTPAINYYAGLFPSSITAADFNGDGNIDLVVTNIDNKMISVLYGNGNGTFQYPFTFPTEVYPISSAAGNFNGGGIDLAVANFTSDTVSVLLNNDTAKVTLSAPNSLADKHLMSGTSFVVSWVADSDAESFAILFSSDNGKKFKRIAQGPKTDFQTAVVGEYNYTWTVPVPKKGPMRDCLIKVIGYGASSKEIIDWDTSNSTFSIDIVKVDDPDIGAGPFTAGDNFTITWTTYATKKVPVSVMFSYSTDYGKTWIEMGSLDANPIPGTYSSTELVPNASSAECLLKVELLDSKGKSLGYDVSDDVFTINPALTVKYPDLGGITLISGAALTVTWETHTPMTVSDTVITYSTDAGATWNPLASIAGHPSPDTWTGTVPVVAVTSTSCLIRVELLANGVSAGYYDDSDNLFTIDP